MTLAIALLAFVTVQRIGELMLARHNTRRLLDRGGIEVGRRHYVLIVALHAAWLAGLWSLGWNSDVHLFWLAVFAVLQVLRIWVIASLGERWTTRIIVVPGEPLVHTGPYRLLRHPNYVIVTAEVAVLPLALGLYWFALVFTLLNGCVLLIRLHAEDRALTLTGADG